MLFSIRPESVSSFSIPFHSIFILSTRTQRQQLWILDPCKLPFHFLCSHILPILPSAQELRRPYFSSPFIFPLALILWATLHSETWHVELCLQNLVLLPACPETLWKSILTIYFLLLLCHHMWISYFLLFVQSVSER